MSRSPAPKDPQRIAKLLARAGIASRREIERMIADGRIAIHGKTLDTPATLVVSLHGITVDGNPVEAPQPTRLFVFHKPAGVLTAERDPKGRPTIYDRLPRDLPRLIPVGRLDYNTEGLLLLTTDGGLKRQLELPSTGVERAYRARAYGNVSQAQLEDLIEGVEIDGIRYGAIDANLERRTGANVWIELILKEGKNREVRRVLEHLGLEVSRLIRVRYGPFVLGDLPVGGIGEVRQHDLVAFRQTLTRGTKSDAPVEVAALKARHAPAQPPAEPERGDTHAPPPRARKPGGSSPRTGPAETIRARVPRERVASNARGAPPQGRDRPTRDAEDRGRGTKAGATAAPTPKPKPKRGAGWAKPKIKPGPKPRGRPKRP
ncbi:pseudouridine synthase [Hephaestia sp. GCM10023244]|uniref:pseudouridine synthase n=1 Tax=unclassified Hephaestia TaxID=2631281 RepID=UPI0020775639|nr:pseudouridine synthase [Hephaestia sp. MAHUQ-44]